MLTSIKYRYMYVSFFLRILIVIYTCKTSQKYTQSKARPSCQRKNIRIFLIFQKKKKWLLSFKNVTFNSCTYKLINNSTPFNNLLLLLYTFSAYLLQLFLVIGYNKWVTSQWKSKFLLKLIFLVTTYTFPS